jgi:ubiquinone/menaquinone biosynthesis C-methylase UbiE
MNNTTGNHWTNYWHEGHITSLPADFDANYEGEIKTFWHHQFEKLEDGALVLDICSGNGAVALLAAEYANTTGKTFNIIATDGAKVDTQKVVQRFPAMESLVKQITFKDQQRLEDMELEPSSVDLITSQYGVEYTDWPQVAEKLIQWVKPQGSLVILAHSRDTDIITQMKNEYKEYQILESTEFFKRAKKILRHNPGQKELQGLLRPVGEELSRSLLTRVSPVLKPMMQAAQFVFKAPPELFLQRKAELIVFLGNIVNAKARLDNLVELHKRLDHYPEWYQAFVKAGFTLQSQGHVVFNKKHPAGDYFLFEKAL